MNEFNKGALALFITLILPNTQITGANYLMPKSNLHSIIISLLGPIFKPLKNTPELRPEQ